MQTWIEMLWSDYYFILRVEIAKVRKRFWHPLLKSKPAGTTRVLKPLSLLIAIRN